MTFNFAGRNHLVLGLGKLCRSVNSRTMWEIASDLATCVSRACLTASGRHNSLTHGKVSPELLVLMLVIAYIAPHHYVL